MRRIRNFAKLLFLCVLPFLFVTLGSCKPIKINPGPFDEYTASIFKSLVSDEMTMNFLFEDPTRFGLEMHLEPNLPTPKNSSTLSLVLLNLYLGQMPYYNYDELNFDEQMTYLIVEDLLAHINSLTSEMRYLDNNYLGSYLGYQAQLPLLLSEYHFRDIQDLENYFKIIDLVPSTFEAYVNYEVEKANAGYGMPDFVIDKVVDQCENFVENVDSHFLITTFENRIDDLSFLTSEQVASYVLINEEKIKGSLINGYKYVRDNLPSIKGKATNDLGLSYYEIGQEYYAIKFKDATGYDISMEEAITYLDNVLLDRYTKLEELESVILLPESDFFIRLERFAMMSDDPLTQVLSFKEKLNGHFPILETYPSVEVKYVDKAMEDNFSPAAYLTSPIDRFDEEYIYLNNKYMDDANYMYTTLAHEGFPGHLYQNIYFKNQEVNPLRRVIKSNGYVEGWATYAEMYSYGLYETADQDIISYLKLLDEVSGAITSRLDIGIHYQGWDASDVKEFMLDHQDYWKLIYDSTQFQNFITYIDLYAQAILEQLVEVPTNSQGYFFTYFKLVDLYHEVSEALGEEFDPVYFHKLILDCGPVPLRYVEEHLREIFELTA